MCTWGSIKPGKTSLPLASMVSVPGGASRFLPMRVIVSSSTKISARSRAPTVTISPFLISKAIGHSPLSVNVDAHLFPVRFHLLPVFGDLGLLLRDFIPGHGRALWRFFDHADAVVNRTNVEAQAATDAILFAHMDARPRMNRFLFSIGTHIVAARRHDAPVLCYQVNTLVRGIVARHITKVAANAFLLINPRHGLEREIKILEIGDAMNTLADNIGYFLESLFIHPIG